MEWLMENMSVMLGVLLGVSEALALIPGFKSNGIFQMVFNALKSLAGK